MHQMLEDLGKSIVQRHFPRKPGSRSRLWLYEDFHHIMISQTATNNVDAIVLDQKVDVSKYSELNAEEFSRMMNLKLLILNHQNFSGNLNFLPNGLHYLTWHGYPFTSLPSNFEPDRLVELNMPNSNIKRLWEGIKHLPNLKRMDLSNSKSLEETPNFEMMQNLERLDLAGCTSLLLVHSSISHLRLLAFLSLQNCCSLVSLDLCRYRALTFDNKARRLTPSCKLDSLRVLHLSGCTKLQKMPDFRWFPNLEYLDFKQCESLSSVDTSIGFLTKLKYLSLRGRANLVRLPLHYHKLTSLQTLDLVGCSNLRGLHLGGCTNLVQLPHSIYNLTSLQTLNLDGCLELKPLAYGVAMPFSSLECLIVLDLGFCNLIAVPDAIGELRCLERLNLEGNKFYTLPSGMAKLLSLAYLNLAHCHELRTLPVLPSQHASSGGRYFKTESGSRNHRSGLYIFDCPNLENYRGYSIRPSSCWALWSRWALPWLLRLVQAPRYFRCGFDIVVPGGTVVSEWFNHQFEGDSITRIVDFDAFTDNWIGFAFFASFETNPRPSTSNDSSSLLLPHPFCLSFETEQAEETFSMPLRLDLATTYTSKHLWLIYISRPHCHFVKSGAHISFKARPDLKIMNWGLRVVFEQDFLMHLAEQEGEDGEMHLEGQEDEFYKEFLMDLAEREDKDFLMELQIAPLKLGEGSQINRISFNYVRANRGSSVSKVQLPYNWLVTDEEERENIEAKRKENNLSNVGLTTSHHQDHTASSSSCVHERAVVNNKIEMSGTFETST